MAECPCITSNPIINLTRGVGESSFNRFEDPTSLVPQQGGSNCLLTSRILFTTHEPCLMYSMALLYSCVAKVVHLM